MDNQNIENTNLKIPHINNQNYQLDSIQVFEEPRVKDERCNTTLYIITNYEHQKKVELKLDLNLKNRKLSDISRQKEFLAKKLYTSNNTSIVENLNKQLQIMKKPKELPNLRISKYEKAQKTGAHDYVITMFTDVDISNRKNVSSRSFKEMPNKNRLDTINGKYYH